MKTILCLLLGLSLSCASLQANTVDSLKLALLEADSLKQRFDLQIQIIDQLTGRNSEEALKYCDSLHLTAQEIGTYKYTEESALYYGIVYKDMGEIEKSAEYLQKVFDAATERNDSIVLGNYNFQLARINQMLGNNDTAMGHYTAAQEIYAHFKDTLNWVQAIDEMSIVFTNLKQNELVLKKRKEAIALLEKYTGEKPILGQLYLNMGNTYGRLGILDTCGNYFKLALDEYSKYDNVGGRAYVYENLSTLESMKGNLDLSIQYAFESLQIRRALGNHRQLINTLEKYGQALSKNNQPAKGLGYIQEALDLALDKKFMPRAERVHRSLSKTYDKLGNYKKALFHANASRALQDSLSNERITRQVSEMDAKYQNTLKQKEIDALNIQKEYDQEIIAQSHKYNWILGIGLVLALILAALIYKLYNQRKLLADELEGKNTVLAKALDEKNFLLREIHHRVKNNLQVITSLLNLQSREIKDEKVVQAINEGKSRVRSMALIHQSLYQEGNLVGINTKSYFEKLISELFATYNAQTAEVELNLNVEDLELDVDTMIPIGLIINELVSNALKHAFKDRESGKLDIDLSLNEDDTLNLLVKDDGMGTEGFSIFNSPQSFGNRLLKAFSKKLDADISVDNSDGVAVQLTIKKYKLAS